MDRRRALADLAAALGGAPPARADWMGLLWLANTSLVTPQLHAAAVAAGAVERLPEEVAAFTAECRRRNHERNRRLFAQLHEAAAALNAHGVEPIVLKGAALWFTLGRPAGFDRMLNDLDLLVAPADADRAVTALAEAGFDVAARYPGPEVHVVAELGRPTDVGFVDLHQRPPGPPGVVELAGLDRHCRTVDWEGVRVRVPSATLQLFLLVLHDQFHDGDFWRGGLSLRHLVDIAELTRGPEPIDWGLLNDLCRTSLVRRAMAAQLVAAHRIAGADIPTKTAAGPWARLHHGRMLWQFYWPRLTTPLAVAAAILEAPLILAHRAADRAQRRRLFGASRAAFGLRERLERLRHILAGEAMGKV